MSKQTLDNVSPSQIRVLSAIVAVNRERQTLVTDWVDQGLEKLHKTSVRSLARKGIVKYDPHHGVVRVRHHYTALAVEAYQVFTGDRS